MKAYLISENKDSLIGLKIAGIKGIYAPTREQVIKALESVRNDREIGIIVFTEKAAAMVPEKIKEIKLAKSYPLIVEIPDINGTIKGDDYIMNYVKESIGLKI